MTPEFVRVQCSLLSCLKKDGFTVAYVSSREYIRDHTSLLNAHPCSLSVSRMFVGKIRLQDFIRTKVVKKEKILSFSKKRR